MSKCSLVVDNVKVEPFLNDPFKVTVSIIPELVEYMA
jgi:hypothetical protein